MWLESHANLARHPKTRRLMKLLGWSLPDTIGNLHLFWWWALDFAPTGDLTRYTPEELTADLDLGNVTPNEFIEAMIQAGFIDRSVSATPESRSGGTGFLDRSEAALHIHDWVEYKRPKPLRKSAGSSRPAMAAQDRPISPSTQAEPQPQAANSHALPTFSPRPVQTGHDPQLLAPPRQDQPNDLSTSDPGTSHAEALNSSSPAVTEQSSDVAVPPQQEPRTAEEELEHRKTFPPRLLRLPGFVDHWWPLYLDFHKKAGIPLTQEAQTNFLAQLAKEPLTAVQQIKRAITQTVRTGILEHAP